MWIELNFKYLLQLTFPNSNYYGEVLNNKWNNDKYNYNISYCFKQTLWGPNKSNYVYLICG